MGFPTGGRRLGASCLTPRLETPADKAAAVDEQLLADDMPRAVGEQEGADFCDIL